MPVKRYPSAALFDLRHNELCQVLALQCLPDPDLQCFALNAAARRPPLQFSQLFLCFQQRRGYTSLLSAQQFLTFHHHQRPVKFSPPGYAIAQPALRSTHSQKLHRPALRRVFQR